MFGSIGFTELILILVIVLIIFGAGKLPQLGEGLGKAIKGFKKSVHEAEAIEAEAEAREQAQAASAAQPQQAPPQPQGEPVAATPPSKNSPRLPCSPQPTRRSGRTLPGPPPAACWVEDRHIGPGRPTTERLLRGRVST